MFRLMCILSLFFTQQNFAQIYNQIDDKVKNYPNFKNIDHLSIRIQNDFKTDSQKIRAAFVWLTENITYGKTLEDLFTSDSKVYYYSPYGKDYQIKKYRQQKIKKAFNNKIGVCYDYSLLLDYLYSDFGIKSKIIYGLSKTDIKDIEGTHLVKNHTWNAVFLDGEWKLLDPTWAAGYFDASSKKYIKSFIEHYYFTEPSDFLKTHFPKNEKWQLIEKPIGLSTFFNAPIFFPGYFGSEFKLRDETKGTLVLTDKNHSVLVFDKLPKKSDIFYKFQGDYRTCRMKFVKKNGTYVSCLKFRKNLKKSQYLTVFNDNLAILNFKVLFENQ